MQAYSDPSCESDPQETAKKTPKPKRYVVCCERCYSCVLLETNVKRDANFKAQGHASQYQHRTWIRDRVEQPD